MQPQHVNGQNICRTGLDYLITGWYPLKKKNWLYFYNSKELRSPEIKTKENTKRTLGEYISQLFDSRNMKHFSNASPSYSWNDMTMDLYILHKLIKNRIMSISKLIYVDLMNSFRAFLNSPIGPKTTHFWGPMANWGFVAAALLDTQKPPEMISGEMSSAMCIYSALAMRFAWMVQPRNHLLLACHISNECVQLYQLSRWAKSQGYLQQRQEDKVQ